VQHLTISGLINKMTPKVKRASYQDVEHVQEFLEAYPNFFQVKDIPQRESIYIQYGTYEPPKNYKLHISEQVSIIQNVEKGARKVAEIKEVLRRNKNKVIFCDTEDYQCTDQYRCGFNHEVFGRHHMSLLQIGIQDEKDGTEKAYLFDVFPRYAGVAVFKHSGLKDILENKDIEKVFVHSKNEKLGLWEQFDVNLQGDTDLQVYYVTLMQRALQVQLNFGYDTVPRIGLTNMCIFLDLPINQIKPIINWKEAYVRQTFFHSHDFTSTPVAKMRTQYAALDVLVMIKVYFKLKKSIGNYQKFGSEEIISIRPVKRRTVTETEESEEYH